MATQPFQITSTPNLKQIAYDLGAIQAQQYGATIDAGELDSILADGTTGADDESDMCVPPCTDPLCPCGPKPFNGNPLRGIA